MPPSALPLPARYCHTTAPRLSGSIAHPMPDFCPMTIRSRPLGSVARIGALPKSKSGPTSCGQFAAVGALHPVTNTSAGVTCDTHTTCPVSMSNAITESLVPCCGSVYMLPVAAYTTWRLTSIVGDDQIAAPAGPQRVVPELLWPMGFDSSGLVYVFQRTAPVAAFSASRLPRNVQHSYRAFAPCPSSPEETGT